MVRRDVFERLDGFDVQFRCFEDSDLFLRADPEGACIVFGGDDLLGRQRGKDDSLIDDWRVVVDGLEKMKTKGTRRALSRRGRRRSAAARVSRRARRCAPRDCASPVVSEVRLWHLLRQRRPDASRRPLALAVAAAAHAAAGPAAPQVLPLPLPTGVSR